jgi:hypothetical protein
MKFKGKEIKILCVKLKHKETDRNGQDQTGSDRIRQDQKETDRNSRNRQDYSSDIENYCIIIIAS